MDVLDGVVTRERALLVEDILIVADLHVGRGSASSVELPVGDGADMVERLESLCQKHDPEEVVIAGDLLHSFETVPRRVERTLAGIRDTATDIGAEMTVTPGNHDTMLDVVWEGPTETEYNVGETVICHGHVEPNTDAERYIIGHDHPTISIEGQRLPCFLGAESVYRGADVLMLPSFNRLVSGVEVNEMQTTDFLSPLITDAERFAPIIRDTHAKETLTFPTLGEFRHRL